MTFHITFASSPVFAVSFASDSDLSADFGSVVEVPVADYYDGDYELAPTQETQVIPIIGKTARQNITVAPIPSNYGLVTWNGAVLTVS